MAKSTRSQEVLSGADDPYNTLVRLGGAPQTITGTKTFTTPPSVQNDPALSNQLVPKSYVDANVASGASEVLTGSGEFVPRREMLNSTAVTFNVSQSLELAYFTAGRTEPINTITTYTSGTPAGATPTLCRLGIYSVAANGDLILIASTPNDTALWAAANTVYPKGLSATFSKIAGTKYAIGKLIVTGAALPTFFGLANSSSLLSDTINRLGPTFFARLNSQTDLPSSISDASLSNGYRSTPGFLLS